jgi:hypothetical protein
MSFKGDLIFDFFDVRGNRLDNRLDLHLRHTVLMSAQHSKKNFDGKKTLEFKGLEGTPSGRFLVQAFPVHYRPVGRFIPLLDGQSARHAFTFPVDPHRVTNVRWPAFTQLPESLRALLDNSLVQDLEDFQGSELFEQLKKDRLQAAGLLNIHAKMRAVTFGNDKSVADFLTGLTRVRGDRIFATVAKELRDAVKNSTSAGLFHKVSDALHTPPPDYERVDSYKTTEHYGNLQLTFFQKKGTLEFLLDSDLDDARGIEHIFQVLSHALTSGATHPYDIHQILLAHHKIDPGYELIV